jgi:pimeloyl-ACP methyl ester carboxylesterase
MMKSRGVRRVIASTASAAAIAIALTACLPFNLLGGGGSSLTSTPTGETVAPELASYYSQVLTWKSCGEGAQCTTVTAPMDWNNPSPSTDIELELARHTASGNAIGSLFVNPGGPGGSGYDFVHDADAVDFAVGSALRKNFDVIGWDPRGVGRSTPVYCYDDAQLDEFIFGIIDAPEGSPEWKRQYTEASVNFGKGCLENTGPSLGFIDTLSTVRDLDLMRALVGDTKLNYLGYSYGSEIGTTYIDTYPDKVGKLVLDGALDPTLTSFEVLKTQSVGFENALHNYLAACPEYDACPFTGPLDKDLARIAKLYDALNASPIAATDGRKMDGHVFDAAVSTALYSQDYWEEYLTTLFVEALRGKTDMAFLLADFYFGRNSDGTYADNSFESFLAIQCLDYEVETDPAVIIEQNNELAKAAPTFNRPSDVGDELCANWPVPYVGTGPHAASGAGADPVLVISTTGDPATPYEWGVSLSKQLQSARLISYEGEGHTAYNKGSSCVDAAVEDYFVKGIVPDGQVDC